MQVTAPSSDERRQFWRTTFRAPVHLAVGGRVHEAQLLDLSLKGALVQCAGDWQPSLGTSCRLRLKLVPGTSIAMDTAVAHVHDQQVGLQCHFIDLDSITHLRRLVELNAGSAAWLERELALLIRPA